ncbi:hypothetical protein NOR_02416 [Metarhizium rileyi]|uniref:Copper acquisition factor BIM1-like domain-containing protein n=1 Tax=Metarhizium rileyi (strain RCEF 4871) TaxID=1649241 RepID=A0A167HHP4_METRR|nr:hypothetical protein NOR_02416 [Metarhizium rileyi RCEF 4871]
MLLPQLVFALAAVHGASAHFGIKYPSWRADTLAAENKAKYSQWSYPCPASMATGPLRCNFYLGTFLSVVGVKYKAGNVTDWPIGGGSLSLDLHHPWTYVFVNLGLGENTTNFNVSLTPQFWNVTGKGTLCVEKLAVPIDVQDGALASLQVVTSGESGSALYNCADIRFKKDAQTLSNCTNSKGMTVKTVTGDKTADSGSNGNSSGNGTADGKKSAGVSTGADVMVLATIVALASVLAIGL